MGTKKTAGATRGGTSHIWLETLPDGGQEGRCDHCGQRIVITLPMDLNEFLKVSRAFIDQHRHCRPKDGE